MHCAHNVFTCRLLCYSASRLGGSCLGRTMGWDRAVTISYSLQPAPSFQEGPWPIRMPPTGSIPKAYPFTRGSGVPWHCAHSQSGGCDCAPRKGPAVDRQIQHVRRAMRVAGSAALHSNPTALSPACNRSVAINCSTVQCGVFANLGRPLPVPSHMQ
jgi:hypothetical protein